MQENIIKNTSFLNASEEEAALMKVRKTIFKYLSNIHLFIIVLALTLGGAYLYLKYTNPVYKATATLLLVKDDKGTGANKDIIDALVNGKPIVNVQDEIELIKSRYLLNRVVEKNNLNIQIWQTGRIKATELAVNNTPFFIQRMNGGDSSAQQSFIINYKDKGRFNINKTAKTYSYYQPFVTNGTSFILIPNPSFFPFKNTDYEVNIFNTRTAANNISAALRITPKSNSSRVVELNYTGTSPVKVEMTLQKIMEEYVQLGLDEKRKVQENTLKFINERIEVLSGELGSVEGKLERFRRSSNVIDVSSQSQLSLDQASEQAKELSKLLVQRQVISYLANYLSNQANSYNLTPTNLGIQDPVLMSLSQNYNTLILEREKELTINTPISPVIKNLEATIEKARASLIENLRSIQANNELSIQRLRGEKNQVQSMISQVPGKERQLGGIMRQEKIKNDLFSYLLQKREETEIALVGALTEAKVFNTALTNMTPISPNRRTVWMVALLIGIAIPLGIIWLKDLLNNKVNTRNDITETLHTPILGEIGHNATPETVVVQPASRKVIGEQFRNLRSNVNFLIPGKKKFVILSTSANAGEGKSFVSLNLAATYALAGKRTVVIELDLRKPKLAKYLNIKSDIGLTDYLVNNIDLFSIVKDLPGSENLKVILSGPIPPNPSELLLYEKMEELIEELKKQFDVIIFDCPPIGLVSDAQIISPYVDLSIFVIRQRVTLKSQMNFINEIHETNRLKNIGIIVNDVKIGGYNGYYGYNSYGYGNYGYSYSINGNESKNGNGYFEKEGEKKNWLVRNILKKQKK